ncbi:MAG: prolyl aminopeptidase [Proteobacteria bacterium]|nr:prolyl aminopeptidase [Pseudomonadota bacterium]
MTQQLSWASEPDLYPPIEPFASGMLEVSDLHSIYYEQSGNPKGKPVVFIHGGPGGGSNPRVRQFFDPDAYRIIVFDQRGCGKSTPHCCLEQNTTWDLVADMERLRAHLGIYSWQLFGGSWGSTLALAYAQSHPAQVSEIILRGIFTLRRSELEWFYQAGASSLFPDAWEAYLAPIPEDERCDLMTAYYRRLTGSDKQERLRAAQAWSVWEGSTSRLLVDGEELTRFVDPEFALAFARIECHYFVNRGFFSSDTQLLDNAYRVRHIPAVIVQGRYDVVCPMATAWELHRRWPEAEFCIVPDAGHSAFEPAIATALVKATDSFRTRNKNI